MVCSSPRASFGFRMEAASIAPSAAPAPTSVDLVDEQDDVAALVDLLEHLLQALLEVTAVAGARDQGTQVQGVNLLIAQGLRNLAVDDVQGQALDDGGLTHARLANEHRVVLGAAGEHLHDALDLAGAADNGVQLAVLSGLREVAAELVQDQGVGLLACLGSALARRGNTGDGRLVRGLLVLATTLVAGEQLNNLLTNAGQVGAQLHQHLGGYALALADEAEQDVLGADVLVAELQCLTQGQLQHLLGAWGKRDITARRVATGADDLLNLGTHRVEGNPHGLERLGGHPFTLLDQPQEDVLGTDVIVIQRSRFLLCQDDNASCPVGKPFEHLSPFSLVRFDAPP